MHRVTKRVDSSYLEQVPPRALRLGVIIETLDDYIFERPRKFFLDPWLLVCIAGLGILITTRASWMVVLVPLLLVGIRIADFGSQIWSRTRDDLALLRQGLLIHANVLALRPHRAIEGEIDGALLDVVIPVTSRRTYVGSIWISDGTEALRLANRGKIEVICLPRTPGTWRIAEDIRSEVQYERMRPIQKEAVKAS